MISCIQNNCVFVNLPCHTLNYNFHKLVPECILSNVRLSTQLGHHVHIGYIIHDFYDTFHNEADVHQGFFFESWTGNSCNLHKVHHMTPHVESNPQLMSLLLAPCPYWEICTSPQFHDQYLKNSICVFSLPN